jgi:hypothetical protein
MSSDTVLTYNVNRTYTTTDTPPDYTGFTHTTTLVANAVCFKNTDMGTMDLDAFKVFFGDSTPNRATVIANMTTILDIVELKNLLKIQYNVAKGLTGTPDEIDTINIAATDLSDFNTALNGTTVADKEFVPSTETVDNHLQIIFNYVCDDVISKASFKWKLV